MLKIHVFHACMNFFARVTKGHCLVGHCGPSNAIVVLTFASILLAKKFSLDADLLELVTRNPMDFHFYKKYLVPNLRKMGLVSWLIHQHFQHVKGNRTNTNQGELYFNNDLVCQKRFLFCWHMHALFVRTASESAQHLFATWTSHRVWSGWLLFFIFKLLFKFN